MTEIRSIAAADRARVFRDALRQRDQQQAEVQRTQNQSSEERLRIQGQAQAEARLAERRIQDRRDLLDSERARQLEISDQQRARARIGDDENFVRRQESIGEQLLSARDTRDLNESLLVRDSDNERRTAAEARTIAQRDDDLRVQLLDREARLVDRRRQERTDAIRQEANLQRSLERIHTNARSANGGAEQPRGAVLDVAG